MELAALLEAFKSLPIGNASGRATLMSTWIVPGFVISCIFSQMTTMGGLSGSENAISSVGLKTSYDFNLGKAKSEQAFALILEPTAGSFSVPWKAGVPRRIWMSLDQSIYDINRDRLLFSPDGFEATLPLWGVSDPVVVIAEGVDHGELLLPGKKMKIEELRFPSKDAAAKALWGMIASIFGLGLVVRSPGSPIQDGTRNQSG